MIICSLRIFVEVTTVKNITIYPGREGNTVCSKNVHRVHSCLEIVEKIRRLNVSNAPVLIAKTKRVRSLKRGSYILITLKLKNVTYHVTPLKRVDGQQLHTTCTLHAHVISGKPIPARVRKSNLTIGFLEKKNARSPLTILSERFAPFRCGRHRL